MASVFSRLPKVIEPFQKCQVKWKSTGQYVLLKVGLFLGESCPLTSFFCFHSTDYTYYIYFVITAKYRYKYQQSASIIGYLVQISLKVNISCCRKRGGRGLASCWLRAPGNLGATSLLSPQSDHLQELDAFSFLFWNYDKPMNNTIFPSERKKNSFTSNIPYSIVKVETWIKNIKILCLEPWPFGCFNMCNELWS